MTTNILVAFYSTYGHVHRMALAVADGAQSVGGESFPDPNSTLRTLTEIVPT